MKISESEMVIVDMISNAYAEGTVYHYNGGQIYFELDNGNVGVIDHTRFPITLVEFDSERSERYKSQNRHLDADETQAALLRTFFQEAFELN